MVLLPTPSLHTENGTSAKENLHLHKLLSPWNPHICGAPVSSQLPLVQLLLCRYPHLVCQHLGAHNMNDEARSTPSFPLMHVMRRTSLRPYCRTSSHYLLKGIVGNGSGLIWKAFMFDHSFDHLTFPRQCTVVVTLDWDLGELISGLH